MEGGLVTDHLFYFSPKYNTGEGAAERGEVKQTKQRKKNQNFKNTLSFLCGFFKRFFIKFFRGLISH
jgi:hypothetical protein